MNTEGIPGCPICDGKRYYHFVWGNGLAAQFPGLNKYQKYLLKQRDLKIGSLWSCRVCLHKWYLDYSGSRMHQVVPEREEILDRWNKQLLELSPSLLAVLAGIGATPHDIFGNCADEIPVPCRVQTKQNGIFDPAIVSFQRLPPIEAWKKEVHLTDEIATIETSEYALPAQVRVATTESDEIRMGFAPTLVIAPDNTPFCLNWTANFFINPSIKADSIRLAPQSIRYDSSVQMISTSESDIPRFIGDWQDRLIALRLKANSPKKAFPLKIVSSGPIA